MRDHRSDHAATGIRRTLPVLLLAAAVAAAGCSTKRVDEEPVIDQGDRIPPASDTVRPETSEDDTPSELSAALAECTGSVCDALARGELALGMTEAQVRAATRSDTSAWRVRRSGKAVIMTPVDGTQPSDDAVGPVAWVQIRDGEVVRYAYRESQGMRLVSSPEDTTLEGRAEARGRTLLAGGDDLAARGALELAHDR
jgi:hypothetical protein